MKKILSFSLLFLMIFVFFPNIAFASEEPCAESENYVYTQIKTQTEVDKELKEKIDNEVNKLKNQASLQTSAQSIGQWKTEYGPKQTKIAKGYAGNQNAANGYRFPTGGGFYYSEGGGPTVSLSYSFPKPFGNISASINLGSRVSSGYFVNVPDTVNYYKLYVEKELEVQPYITYTRPTYSDGPWQVYYRGQVSSEKSVVSYAKRVN